MKVALLSAGSSVHTVRWVRGLAQLGLEVHLISQHPLLEPLNDVAEVHQFPFRGGLGYFTMVPGVRKLLRRIKPDLVNAHYASGYGTTGRLAGYRPWILSIWGSDVYKFPFQSPFHKKWIVKNLKSANRLISTSKCMAAQANRLCSQLPDIRVVPFGVELGAFSGVEKQLAPENSPLIVGTIKTMDSIYGIDILLRAFKSALSKLTAMNPSWSKRLSLRLVGAGPSIDQYRRLSADLGIAELTEFVGSVPHSEVPRELLKFDIFAALSREESFGVAVIEAGAAGLPVVVSNAEGLAEVVLDGKTGIIVPRENVEAAADALVQLVRDRELRQALGREGRRHTYAEYNWAECLEKMIQAYQQTILESSTQSQT